MIRLNEMTIEEGMIEFSQRRVAELRHAVVAGEYAPSSERVAEAVIATVGTIRRARRRVELLDGPRFEPEARPPRRRFAPRAEPAHLPR